MFLEEAKKYQVLPLNASVGARIAAAASRASLGRARHCSIHGR